MKIALEYPTYYQLAEMNKTDFFSVSPNRYIVPQESWDAARLRAGRALRDTLGERYTVPIGMSSIEGLAGFPVFLSTPHHYGNKDWGGKEYTFFHFLRAPFKADNTDKEDRIAHWYFSDIEPISGMVVRRARRLQWAFRLERTSLFPFLMYSQGYCKVPTNDFNENGYGCFCFIPAWWVDDEYVLDERGTLELFNRTLLTVPERVLNTGLIGALGGAVITVLGTMIVMRRSPPPSPPKARAGVLCSVRNVIVRIPPHPPLAHPLQAQRAEVSTTQLCIGKLARRGAGKGARRPACAPRDRRTELASRSENQGARGACDHPSMIDRKEGGYRLPITACLPRKFWCQAAMNAGRAGGDSGAHLRNISSCSQPR